MMRERKVFGSTISNNARMPQKILLSTEYSAVNEGMRGAGTDPQAATLGTSKPSAVKRRRYQLSGTDKTQFRDPRRKACRQ
jgi:hypothetical protein